MAHFYPRGVNLEDSGASRDPYLAQRLRFVRRLSGLTQSKVAEHLGLSFQQVQKYETGRNRISASALYELSELFGLPMDWFVRRANPGPLPDQPGLLFPAIVNVFFEVFNDRPDMAFQHSLNSIMCAVGAPLSGLPDGRLNRLRLAIVKASPRQLKVVSALVMILQTQADLDAITMPEVCPDTGKIVFLYAERDSVS